MRIERLRIEQFRIIESLELHPGPGINLLTGANGAGKTSIIEALHLLAYGRSFRAPLRDVLIRRGASELSVFAEVRPAEGAGQRRLGLSSSARSWQAKVDGESVGTLGELLQCCPVVCFEPGSHALIAGGSEGRRRFVDWGLFHVEQTFTSTWRRYQRALRQRNALLKEAPASDALDAWDTELADAGEYLHRQREHYLRDLTGALESIASRLMPEVGPPSLRYLPGWRSERESLAEALLSARQRDRVLGHTSLGPHRANWDLSYPALPQRESFSRGQEKLTALICVLAQAAHFAAALGHWPIIALDDLGSELDTHHQRLAVEAVAGTPAQIWISGTVPPQGLEQVAGTVTRFHVEQGTASRAL